MKKSKHADCAVAKIKQDEKAVQDISACFSEFKCDPFDMTNTQLQSLQSGLLASDELVADLETAKSDGKKKVPDLMNNRVYSKSASLSDRISCSKRLIFANQCPDNTTCLENKISTQEMEHIALAAVIELVETSGAFSLEEVLDHHVTD